MLVDLTTARGEQLLSSRETPWSAYPRPQMRRDSYVNLNGAWEFFVNYESQGMIRLPFCPESRLSAIGRHYEEGSLLSYSRDFTLPEGFHRGRVLLHIGAADQRADVFLNGKPVGFHRGGYEAFTLDITDALEANNRLTICCTDDLEDKNQPYGKQTLTRGGMWYTPVSGIWQTVWLESVPQEHIQKLNIENRGYAVTISIEPKLEGKVIVPMLGDFMLTDGAVTITPENPQLWSPENPYLYDFIVETKEDRVESYFAIRSLEVKKIGDYPRLCLNGKPYFFHGLLDQGYWPDGIFTPAKPECYADDISAMKRLGFNMLRKHIKVEPEEFYYQCDKLGMIVFQDMVNNGHYSFLRDTALPTVGLKKRNDKKLHKDPSTRKAFLRAMEETVRALGNHPCICYWTIFNEGWGQFDGNAAYEALRALDDTRFIDTASGWFAVKNSDVDSPHVYFKPVKCRPAGKPLLLSEFGGYSLPIKGHVSSPDRVYGYRKFTDESAFGKALLQLYREEILPAARAGLSGAIYTQLTDIEDEINGLMTYDRRHTKVNAEKMAQLARELCEAATPQ